MRSKHEIINNPVVIDIDGKSFGASRCRITESIIKFVLASHATKLMAMIDQTNTLNFVIWDNRQITFEGEASYDYQKDYEFTFRIVK